MFNKIKYEQDEYGKQIVVFGASQQAVDLFSKLKEKNIKVTAFVDNDKKKWGMEFEGIRIMSPKGLCQYDENNIIIIIASTTYAKDIKCQIERLICCETYELEEMYMVYNSTYSNIKIPTSNQPLVSVVLTVHNQWNYTYNCIHSFAECKCNVSYEFIIGDNVSTDETAEIENMVSGAKIIHRKEDIGYLRNVNETVKYAKGKYILIIQNDTYFIDNYWIDVLVNYMETNDNCAAIAPLMCGFDGKFGIGGCGVELDGRVTPIIGSKSDIPYSVAYIQPAAVLIRKDIWDSENGFDEIFCPAWCEDEDFYLKLYDNGYDVVIHPKVKYIHYGSKTCGVCPSNILENHMRKLLEKWGKKLPEINCRIKENNKLRGIE